jgi:hypothetical protein
VGGQIVVALRCQLWIHAIFPYAELVQRERLAIWFAPARGKKAVIPGSQSLQVVNFRETS